MRTRRLSSLRSDTSWWAFSTLQGWPGVGYWMSGTSKQVSTFTTPGRAWAAEMSMDLTQPSAMVLWRIFASSTGRGQRSSVYLARPVTLSAASTRGMLLPTSIKRTSFCLCLQYTAPGRKARSFPAPHSTKSGPIPLFFAAPSRIKSRVIFLFLNSYVLLPGTGVQGVSPINKEKSDMACIGLQFVTTTRKFLPRSVPR